MNAWRSSHLYRLWVIGGLLGVVAFAVIGGLRNPSDQGFVFYLIGVIAVWVFGIFLLQWRALRRDLEQEPGATRPWAGLLRWNIVFGAVLCAAIFAGVFLFYKHPDNTLYPLGESGPGLPVFLIPAVVLIIYGALRTLHLVREMGRSGGPPDPSGERGIEGPTDIQAKRPPAGRRRAG